MLIFFFFVKSISQKICSKNDLTKNVLHDKEDPGDNLTYHHPLILFANSMSLKPNNAAWRINLRPNFKWMEWQEFITTSPVIKKMALEQ